MPEQGSGGVEKNGEGGSYPDPKLQHLSPKRGLSLHLKRHGIPTPWSRLPRVSFKKNAARSVLRSGASGTTLPALERRIIDKAFTRFGNPLLQIAPHFTFSVALLIQAIHLFLSGPAAYDARRTRRSERCLPCSPRKVALLERSAGVPPPQREATPMRYYQNPRLWWMVMLQ